MIDFFIICPPLLWLFLALSWKSFLKSTNFYQNKEYFFFQS